MRLVFTSAAVGETVAVKSRLECLETINRWRTVSLNE